MRTLLAYDGSPGAANAVALAASIAWPRGSAIQVAGVLEPILMPIAGPLPRADDPAPALEAAMTEFLDEAIRGAVAELGGPGVSVDGTVLHGRPASAILDRAREFGADLVIVGSRGHGQITSLLLGSVATEVADHAACPVLVARDATMRRIVLATDDSAASRAAEAIVARWPIFVGSTVRVMSVADVTPPWKVAAPWTSAIAPSMHGQVIDAYIAELASAKEGHRLIAEAAATRLRAAGHRAEGEMRAGDAAAEIIGAAEEIQADLIVIGSRGRSGLTRLLLGSVARNVLSGSAASVLITREAASEHGGEAPAFS